LLALPARLCILLYDMSKIQPLKRTSTLALRNARSICYAAFTCPRVAPWSFIERYLKCGKTQLPLPHDGPSTALLLSQPLLC